MDAHLQSSDEHEVSVSFKEADIGMLYIIQHELHKSTDVEFAGVIVKHPLTNECWMRVLSKSDPHQNIAEAADEAIRTVGEIRDAMHTDIRIP